MRDIREDDTLVNLPELSHSRIKTWFTVLKDGVASNTDPSTDSYTVSDILFSNRICTM